jgi:prepilin-type N-terminal cleavage/methylation domain-containing protein
MQQAVVGHRGQEGFTLIEIIAVIIIMGILAAVAIPKFFSMQEDAKVATLNGGLAEAAARFNHAFAKYILVEKVAPSNVLNVLDNSAYLGDNATTTGASIGDFVVKWTKLDPDGLVIEILTAETIKTPALSSMPASLRTKTISGITWGP